MTLSVAVKLSALIGEDESILFMTDSLLTKEGRVYRNNGAKIWKLAPKIGAVFAGNVRIGETTLTRAQELISELGPTDLESITNSLQRAVYESYQEKRKTDFILGAVSRHGEARLYASFHDEGPGFLFEVRGEKPLAIGHPDAVAALGSEEPASGPIYPPPGGHVDDTLVLPLIHLGRFQKALPNGGPTVGYPMQVLLISRRGEETLHQSTLEEGSERFKRYTAKPGEVHSEYLDDRRQSQRPRARRRRPPSDSSGAV